MKSSKFFFSLTLLCFALFCRQSLASASAYAQEKCHEVLTPAPLTETATATSTKVKRTVVQAELRRMRMRAGKIKPYYTPTAEATTSDKMNPPPQLQTDEPALNPATRPAMVAHNTVVEREAPRKPEPDTKPLESELESLRREMQAVSDQVTNDFKFIENAGFKTGLFTAIGNAPTFAYSICDYLKVSRTRGTYIIESSGYLAAVDPTTRVQQFLGRHSDAQVQYGVRLALRDLWFKEHSIPSNSRLVDIDTKTRARIQYLTSAPDKQKTLELQNIILSDAFKTRLKEYARQTSSGYAEPTMVDDSTGAYLIYTSASGGGSTPVGVFTDAMMTPLFDYVRDELLHREFGVAFDGSAQATPSSKYQQAVSTLGVSSGASPGATPRTTP